ncbi:MAG TPA: hypothetical protein P5572_14285 [Phycisphaerae bacterium]|nr:hypothetical protein [Phycisphaerales bacterium]HRX86184.1 hypothetical protein [Phycisphaerae bacterium]
MESHTTGKTNETLSNLRRLLDAGKYREAGELIRHCGVTSGDLTNAYGVVLMRSGETAKAVDLYRSLVASAGVSMRADAPTLFKTNFAAALLVNGNVSGCESVLDEIGHEDNAGVIRLRQTIRRWKRSLPIWRRIWLTVSGEAPQQTVTLDFAPSDQLADTSLRPAA